MNSTQKAIVINYIKFYFVSQPPNKMDEDVTILGMLADIIVKIKLKQKLTPHEQLLYLVHVGNIPEEEAKKIIFPDGKDEFLKELNKTANSKKESKKAIRKHGKEF